MEPENVVSWQREKTGLLLKAWKDPSNVNLRPNLRLTYSSKKTGWQTELPLLQGVSRGSLGRTPSTCTGWQVIGQALAAWISLKSHLCPGGRSHSSCV